MIPSVSFIHAPRVLLFFVATLFALLAPVPSAASVEAATAHGIAHAIISLRDDALRPPLLSWPIVDRPFTLGVPYHLLPISLFVPNKGIIGGELDNDDDPATATEFVDADAPPAISGWTGSAKKWSRTNGAGVTTIDTVALYSKAVSGLTYFSFGWWTRVPDSAAVGLGTFGNDPDIGRRNNRSLNIAWTRGANAFLAGRHKYWPGIPQLKALSGTATYVGTVAGLLSERGADEQDGASGAFTADVILTVDFDHGEGSSSVSGFSVSGTITNFRDSSGASLGNWEVTLAREHGGEFSSTLHGGATGYWGNTSGAAAGRNWTGGWHSQFFRRAATDSHTAHPTMVGGVFQAHRGMPGRVAENDQGFIGVVGAFGAELTQLAPQTTTVSLSATPNRVTEGSPVSVRATLSAAATSTVNILVTLTAGTAESRDYGTLSSISISSGQTSGTGTITTNQDTDIDDETFTVALGTLPSGVTEGSPTSVTITIVDDDKPTNQPTNRQSPLNTGGSGGGGRSGPPAQSSDASLDTLEFEEDFLDLDPQKDDYTLDAYGETSLTLIPTANHPDAEITVDGETVESGADISIDLEDDGVTVIEIVVTAEDGTSRTYTLTVMSCSGEERKILEMLYDSTQGDMWEQSSGWNTEDDLNNWHGVQTQDGRVTVLSLEDNGLSGDMPTKELLCLTELKELALWGNEYLSGEEPDELVPAVERAVLRDVAEALELNPAWFDTYEDPYGFGNWHRGVTMDDDGRVTGFSFSGEDSSGVIPAVLLRQLERLETLDLECSGITLEGEVPEGVEVKEGCDEEEDPPGGGGGCALGSSDGSGASGAVLVFLLVVVACWKRRGAQTS